MIMLVEYGKLKMFLVVLQGLLLPFQTSLADNLPPYVKLVAACLQGGTAALFMYLLKPASSTQLQDLQASFTELKPLAPDQPLTPVDPPLKEGK